jgi:hypothetical protein
MRERWEALTMEKNPQLRPEVEFRVLDPWIGKQ